MGKIIEFKKRTEQTIVVNTETMVNKDEKLCNTLTDLVAEHMKLHPTMPSMNIERIKFIVDRVYNHTVLQYNRELR